MKTKLACALCILFALTVSLLAQDTRGAINGRITDPTGAVIPGAAVTVTNTAMGLKTSVTTNQDGYYQALFLPPGPYRVEAAAEGFKKAVRDSIQVRVADRLEIDLALEVGASEQSVTITAEVPLMNTETASAGTVIDSKRISDLPVSYGNPFLLIGLTA